MNKRDLIDAIAGRMGDKKTATEAVNAVLETIQAEQELTRARTDYLRAIADFNKAQYALLRAIGEL